LTNKDEYYYVNYYAITDIVNLSLSRLMTHVGRNGPCLYN